MANKIGKLLDALSGSSIKRIVPDASQDLEGFLLGTQAEEVIELTQVG